MHSDNYLPLRIQLRPDNTSIISCFCFLDPGLNIKVISHSEFLHNEMAIHSRERLYQDQNVTSQNHIKAFGLILCFFFTLCLKQ